MCEVIICVPLEFFLEFTEFLQQPAKVGFTTPTLK